MGRTYHKLSVGRESFEIDTRQVLSLWHGGASKLELVQRRCIVCCTRLMCRYNYTITQLQHVFSLQLPALLRLLLLLVTPDSFFRYTNLKPIGDGSYGFVCSAEDSVRCGNRGCLREIPYFCMDTTF